MPTMENVAKAAVVSAEMVSRIINSKAYVNTDTKEKVYKVIDQINERPNGVEQRLFKGRSKMIALFVPDIMNPFFPELARGVEDFMNQNGYTFVLCNTDNNPAKEEAYMHALKQKSVDGMIVVSSTISEEHVRESNIPIIALDRILNANLSSITVKNRKGARKAVQHLKSLGCHRIAHICGPENASNTLDRLGGFLDEVKEEPWFLSSYIQAGGYNYSMAVQATKELLVSHPEIDGIFAANDLMGAGVLRASQELGFHVPEDLAVVAFDGIKLSETTSPTLTTMVQPIYEIGRRAAEILDHQIKHPEDTIQAEEFKVELVQRESTQIKR
ncbi:LacI family DNA-binding transcriptional regulator [Oceanobacillus timonensis]|uniref:LacI family DNA-binding transcriptional regulator n=1 Tax=Oceanobacillus timonensis TaxID=1926285 RepID=UPI0009BA0F72|nr:LacI family DNA-binding transcriptional regulator [Oceanobacillus timonensis]